MWHNNQILKLSRVFSPIHKSQGEGAKSDESEGEEMCDKNVAFTD